MISVGLGITNGTDEDEPGVLLFILGHANDAALNVLLTDQEYRGRMAGAASVLFGICDEILRRPLTFSEE